MATPMPSVMIERLSPLADPERCALCLRPATARVHHAAASVPLCYRHAPGWRGGRRSDWRGDGRAQGR